MAADEMTQATDFLPIHGAEASAVLLVIAIVALLCLYAWLLADEQRRL